jgi:hypothetical protein
MQGKQKALATLIGVGACAAMMLCAATGFAQDSKANPTGTWTWTGPARGGGDGPTMTLKLKADGSKLTGSLTAPGRGGGDPTDTPISAGKIDGDKISFDVVMEFNGNSRTNKYEGKIAGDTITGTTSGGGGRGRNGGGGGNGGMGGGTNGGAGGAPAGRPWEAKRSK